MAHMIEALDLNVTALGDARAWHSLDTQHDFASMDAPSIAAVMGLDFEVSLEQLMRPSGALIDGHFGLFNNRLPDSEVLQVVGERFRPVQPTEFFDWAYRVIDELGAKIVSGGTLRNTRHAFVCAELPAATIDLGHGDTLKKYLFFGISWDGKYPIVSMLNDIRTVCMNTTPSLETIDKAGKNLLFYQKRHGQLNGAAVKATVEAFRSMVDARRQQAQDVLGKLTTSQYDTVNPQTLLKFAAVMADGRATLERIISFDQAQVNATSFLDKCVNATIDAQAWAAVRTAGMSNKANRVVAEAMNGLGQDLPTARGTLWGVLNGYTYWTDHLSGRDDANRNEDVVFGGYTQDKANAMLLLSAIANTPATLG